MPLKIMEETTVWNVEYQQPNHVYLIDGDKVYAYSKWGKSKPEYMRTPLRIDRRGRKFVEAKKNRWGFDLSIVVDQEPKGRVWTVKGSKGDEYEVSEHSGNFNCTCQGFKFRGQCKHVESIRQEV